MRATAATVDDWEQVISSPMQRCIAFAKWLSNERDLPLEVVTDLREIGFGSWEGVSRSELREQRRDEYEAFYQDPVHNRPAGAEPLVDFGHRVACALDDAAEQYLGKRVLIVAHAGVIRAAIGYVLQSPPALWYQCDVANAGLTRLVRDKQAWRLVRHNCSPTMED